MLSPRLLAIASFIKKDAIVLDVGTDHAYLPIYLVKNKLCKKVMASDISESALQNAKNNLKRFNIKNIDLFLTDGIDGIKEKYDTLTISGMGTNTIKNILNNHKLPKYIILSSNNNLEELRLFMNKKNYKINEEIAVLDHGKYYDIILYEKGIEILSKKELIYGKCHNKNYFKYLYLKQKYIFREMNLKNKVKNLPKLIQLKLMSI